MLTRAQIKKAGTEAKKAVEHALSAHASKPKRRKKTTPEKSAFDTRQEAGPFLSDTLERVIQAGLRTGALAKGLAQQYRANVQGKSEEAKKRIRDGLRRDLESLGVRFLPATEHAH